MAKILIIGCDGVASVAIQKCAKKAYVFSEICIASRTVSKCDALKEKLSGAIQIGQAGYCIFPMDDIYWKHS